MSLQSRLEVRRLRRHFARVLERLEAAPPRHLDEARRANRRRHIDELRRYASRGRFPRNLDFARRAVPYFVDAAGTRCAMAHLIDASGANDLVDRIAHTANHAFIPDLAADADLVAWLDRAGLTVDEAAAIQPAYCSTFAKECLCGGLADGVLEVRVDSVDASGFTGTVTAKHGAAAAQVGESISNSAFFPLAIGDDLLVSVPAGHVYRLLNDQLVDTSTCSSISLSMLGNAPDTAAKDAAIAALLSTSCMNTGLPAEWTNQVGGGCGSASSGYPGSTGPTTTGSGGDDEDGSTPASDEDSGGCAVDHRVLSPAGGALLIASALLSAAIGLRTRRRR